MSFLLLCLCTLEAVSLLASLTFCLIIVFDMDNLMSAKFFVLYVYVWRVLFLNM